jgi:hypothetical protein
MVLQGEVIGDSSAMDWQLNLAKSVPVSDIPALLPLIQGEVIGDYKMTGFPVPRAMIGQHPWYGIMPREIGPMRQAGGRIEMVVIGQSFKPNPYAVFVDNTQAWQATAYEFDKAGLMNVLYQDPTLGAPEPIASHMLAQPLFPDDPVVTVPRGAVYRSGLAKRTTAPVVPADFGGHSMEGFVETTRRWFVGGVTRTGAGAALGNCRVVLMRPDKFVVSPDILANPVVAETTSDGSGVYLIQVASKIPHQLVGYLEGAPDLGGITVNDVIPEDV